VRSPALTTYDTGPTAEPWIMLADIQQGRYVTMEGSTMRMTRKKIYQPVIHTVWNIETCQLLKKSQVTDRIKRFTKIKCNDSNVWVIIEKLSYSVK